MQALDPNPPSPTTFGPKVGLVAMALAVGTFFLALGAFLIIGLVPIWPHARSVPWGGYALIAALGLGLDALGVAFLRLGVLYFSFRAEVAPDGLRVRRLFGRGFWPWDEVETLWCNGNRVYLQGRPPGTVAYRIDLRDGRRLRLDCAWVADGGRLGTLVEGHVTRVGTPRAVSAYDRGKPVRFGPLTVTREGLTAGEKRLAWKDVSGVELLDGGIVTVRSRDGWSVWFRCLMSKVPNLPVFFALTRQLLLRGEGGSPTRRRTSPEKRPGVSRSPGNSGSATRSARGSCPPWVPRN